MHLDPNSHEEFDPVICRYIEHVWQDGEPYGWVGDVISVGTFCTACSEEAFLFMAVAYGLDTGEEDTENYYLNVSRHGFNCSMRFSTMLEEWIISISVCFYYMQISLFKGNSQLFFLLQKTVVQKIAHHLNLSSNSYSATID